MTEKPRNPGPMERDKWQATPPRSCECLERENAELRDRLESLAAENARLRRELAQGARNQK